jgi:hypothetical protein
MTEHLKSIDILVLKSILGLKNINLEPSGSSSSRSHESENANNIKIAASNISRIDNTSKIDDINSDHDDKGNDSRRYIYICIYMFIYVCKCIYIHI